MKHSSLSKSLASAFNIPLTSIRHPPTTFRLTHKPPSQSSPFSTTSQSLARQSGREQIDSRVRLIKYHLAHPLTPRPLRFSRNRALRHWTIHRAAQLLLHKTRRERERALEKQYDAMRAACEELRLGVGDGGKLYRQAVTKKGHFGGLGEGSVKGGGAEKGESGRRGGGRPSGAVPIEYARSQTDGPPRGGFNEGWTRA